MNYEANRREFLKWSAAGAVASTALGATGAEDESSTKRVSANDKIVLAVMGVNGRGSALAQTFMANPGAEIAYVCDVDQQALDKAMVVVEKGQSRKPQAVRDFRKALDDKSVDALVVAAPNHWHAPATILGCSAGKHVYVEKPCSHNPREGELAVEASRKYKRVVQMGSQRRSRPSIIEAVKKVQDGAIGRVMYARTWYNNRRGAIGKGQPAEVPSHLDYALWQGPAPARPFMDNVVHYKWHWFWHWGNGELGNNGIHALDVARWALNVTYPTRVASGGAKHRWEDDQQTPDTHIVTYDFGDKTIVWEGLSWSAYGPGGSMFGMSFHGDAGTLLLADNGYKIFDLQNKETGAFGAKGGDGEHIANFLDCIRSGDRPNADIEEGHRSTLLCHLGNISHRVNRVLTIDPQSGRIQGDEQAMQLWSREYQPGWEPKV